MFDDPYRTLIMYQGNLADRDFLAFYIKDHRILAVAGMNRDRDLAIWEELIRLNQVPAPGRLSDNPVDALNDRPDAARHSAPVMLQDTACFLTAV
jgi:hypothetical protein